ncbi:uncharacterized protein EV422DRAFT_521827 [Fimicolochytrium jonesii]|uniref:uncharacterized protein n=1 Tax=Fimicolochytrium jonesii TaxID=1396493 RepID=UPI0022FED64A|nr:uncharacterized protein EV422DRAFT_521827 [Fimicolochytrium jonesii]KAI8823642.1 hypothetical protein EV422DRAFT_521827 [Fimicolochytrium jonesii]
MATIFDASISAATSPTAPTSKRSPPTAENLTWPSPPATIGGTPAAVRVVASPIPRPEPMSLPAGRHPEASSSLCSCDTAHRGFSSRHIVKRSHNRRKQLTPHKSITYSAALAQLSRAERQLQGIIALDVYGVFMSRPSLLLYDKSAAAGRARMMRLKELQARHGDLQGIPWDASAIVPRTGGGGRKRRGRPGRKTTGTPGTTAPNTAPGSPAFDPASLPLPASAFTMLTTNNAPVVTWSKGDPLEIPESSAGYSQLTSEEVRTCRTLRLYPATYLQIKTTLLQAPPGFKKREAQKWCRVDVNKTGKLYDWFAALGWIHIAP